VFSQTGVLSGRRWRKKKGGLERGQKGKENKAMAGALQAGTGDLAYPYPGQGGRGEKANGGKK